jgi:hypothetical protein
MKFYIYTSIILILLGFTLAGCARVQEKAATNPSNHDNEKDKAITVYKSPTCGCCTMWEDHLSKAGFKVTSQTTNNMAEIRRQFGVPEEMQSCHTAVIEGFVIEGHVPADDIKKLLETRPADVVGLTAPGMPPKSPGMQPEGEKPSGYDVLSFDRQGNAKVFASYK